MLTVTAQTMQPETLLPCRVSIIIKALNEEKRIAKAISSALAAIENIGGEVILADSCSTDKTVEIAQKYPITIVQLANPNERCCGIGPQLGYQHTKGEFVYILDGDMEMLPGFLEVALDFLDSHPKTAGVGGRVVEMNTESLEYRARMERSSGHMQPGPVDRLDMGGLYRRSAVDQTGFFSNRNLHSYEEYDLAVRLRSLGWEFYRLNVDSVNHHGHDAPPYQLMFRRWKTAYICGLGEVIRAAIGKPHFLKVLTEVRELRIYLVTLLWWLIIIFVIFSSLSVLNKFLISTGSILFFVAGMTIKKRSLRKGFYSIFSWCMNTAGLIRGLLKRQNRPEVIIQSLIIK